MHSCQVNEQRRMPKEHSYLKEATPGLARKLKPQQRNERDSLSGSSIILSGMTDQFTGSTEQSFRNGEARYYGLLDSIVDGLINSVGILPDLGSIYRNVRVHKQPPGLGVPQLAPLSFLFRWFLSSLGGHSYSGMLFWIVSNLVS